MAISLARPAVLLATLLLLAGCGKSQSNAQKQAPPPPAVTVAVPIKRMVADEVEFVGRFIAVDAVDIRARVSGYLAAVHFRDGAMVKAGDPLFTIDRRPFETALEQAKATAEQGRANLAFAEADLERAQSMTRGATITQQLLDQRIQAKNVAVATAAAQAAAVRQATLDLEFSELRAPISGRIGDRRASAGSLVNAGTTANATMLATIQSIDPIRLEFTLDEASYLRLMRAHGTIIDPARSVPVKLKLLDEPDFGHDGRLDFIDNAFSRSSGTIRGRAEFANAKGVFAPGMFARIRLAVAVPAEVLLVPDVAIGTEQVRKFVLAVDAENVARPKYVTLGASVDGLRVIKDGLAAEDRVIINGLMRARPGTKVTPTVGTFAGAGQAAAPPTPPKPAPATPTKSN